MSNASRQYAQDLVGLLNRDHYNTQREVAQNSAKTNWEDLTNQYKNVIDKLKVKQENANNEFAMGLTNVNESDFARSKNAYENMAKKGLATSGLTNIVGQANTTKKGDEILNLLGKATDVTVDSAEQVGSAGRNLVNKGNSLSNDLSDTLGDIGARETNAQMEYNTGLANIAGSKDSRDMENELAAMRLAAQERSSGRSKALSDKDEELEDFYKRSAINSILQGINPETGEDLGWDDTQKSNALKILFDMENSNDVVSNHNKNLTVSETNTKNQKKYDEELSLLIKDYDKMDSKTKKAIQNAYRNNTIDYAIKSGGLRGGNNYGQISLGRKEDLGGLKNDGQIQNIINALGTPSPSIKGNDTNLDINRLPGLSELSNRQNLLENAKNIGSNSDLRNFAELNKLKENVSEKDWEKIIKNFSNRTDSSKALNKTKNAGPNVVNYKDLEWLFSR